MVMEVVAPEVMVVEFDRFCAQYGFRVRYALRIIDGADVEPESDYHLGVD